MFARDQKEDTLVLPASDHGLGDARVLMCPPEYFAVQYEINPWMNTRRAVITALARAQWLSLHRTLSEEIGVTVELVQPMEGLPDFVFTANAGFTWGNTFVASSFRHPERSREEPHWLAWFAARGYDVLRLPPHLNFEGEGDVLQCGGMLVAGYRFRSDRRAVCRVGELLGLEVLGLQLADPWFYHLDTCLCPLDKDTVLYYPDAFTLDGRRVILERFSDAIEVSAEEANRFACNSVVIYHHVVMSTDCPLTRGELHNRGYVVHQVDTREFHKAGGGAKCLVLCLSRTIVAKPASGLGHGEHQDPITVWD